MIIIIILLIHFAVRVHLWDLSGHNDYQEVRNELYADTQACFIVFDVTNKHSFENLDNWLREFTKHCQTQSHVVVVGNKVLNILCSVTAFNLFFTTLHFTLDVKKHFSLDDCKRSMSIT